VEFEWDPTKAEANLRKHRVPLRQAIECFDDNSRLERFDDSSYYGEERWILIGRSRSTVLFVVYTPRDEKIRLISARKADRYEQQLYWNSFVSS
jgi:uncharacterized DUF497 family protein